MRFRPCIDIHNGKVKQIVGGSLADAGDRADENFVAPEDAAYFASLFKKDGLAGGHVILLNPASSPYYEATRAQAFSALRAFPGGLSCGGGITPENAADYLDAGASHVIVTSYVFRDGRIAYDRIAEMVSAVGKEHLILDLSCRRKAEQYFVVTDRWQKFTDTRVTPALFRELASSCDEFLVHGVDAEGKSAGAEEGLLRILGEAADGPSRITYAGGIASFPDLDRLRALTEGRADVTIGSALSIYGGALPYEEVIAYFS